MTKTKVFVYGTLVHQRVLSAVLGRSKTLPAYTPARLNGFTKHGLNIYINDKDWVQGYVMDVNDNDLAKLDHYENISGGLYKKIDVQPVVDKKEVDAIAYQLTEFSL